MNLGKVIQTSRLNAVTRFFLAIITVLAMGSTTTTASADVTLHFDLPSAPLGSFGLQWSADFLSSIPPIDNGVISSTRVHLEFNTTTPPNPFQNAANLAIQIQPPAGSLPVFTLTGAQLGWSGTGTFVADFQTNALNLPIIEFPPDADFALWFVNISNAAGGSLGGKLTNSYIEFDVQTIPSPGPALLFLFGIAGRRRR